MEINWNMREALLEELKTLLKEDSIRYNEPMRKHTTFRVGGNAAVMVFPKTVEEISSLLKWKEENQIPFVTVGNGSNLLVSDTGFDGVVMKLQSNFNEVKEENGKIDTLVRDLKTLSIFLLPFYYAIKRISLGLILINITN